MSRKFHHSSILNYILLKNEVSLSNFIWSYKLFMKLYIRKYSKMFYDNKKANNSIY